jgi:hypothetical protein
MKYVACKKQLLKNVKKKGNNSKVKTIREWNHDVVGKDDIYDSFKKNDVTIEMFFMSLVSPKVIC